MNTRLNFKNSVALYLCAAKYLLVIFISVYGTALHGQLADLIISGVSVSTFTTARGGDVSIDLEIKKIGTKHR